MSSDFQSLLDQCLSQITSEEDIQACLKAHPAQAERLAPLLWAAWQLRVLREVPPRSPAMVAAGRQAFLQQAMAYREKRQRSFGDRVAAWWRGAFPAPATLARGMAMVLAVALFVVVFLGGGALAVSARSLPGDPFYPFKLARERVQLWLTFDETAREELTRRFDQRRLEETKALLEERRAASVSFKGSVTRISDYVVLIGGVTVTLPINVPLDRDIYTGAEVEVQGWTQPDGSVIARQVEVREKPTPTPEPTKPMPSATATNSPLPTTTNTLKPTDTPIPPTKTPSPEPTATDTPWPTKTPEPTDTPFPSISPTASPTWEPSPTLTLKPTATPTATITHTRTPTPTATATQARPIKLQFEGAVTRIGVDAWEIGGQVVLITTKTVIDKRGGNAEVGAWARVTAARRADGALEALEIVIERPAQRPPEVTEFQGVIEAISESEWRVSGRAIRITSSTRITGVPTVGWVAWVRAERQGTGPWVAIEIRVQEPEIVVQFEGVIESLSPSQWTIEGYVVLITPATIIEGTPAVGLVAEVEAIQRADGSLVARWIRVHPSTTPTPIALATVAPGPGTAADATPTPAESASGAATSKSLVVAPPELAPPEATPGPNGVILPDTQRHLR